MCPKSMPGPSLIWQFAIDRTAAEVAKVSLPYKPSLLPPTIAQTQRAEGGM